MCRCQAHAFIHMYTHTYKHIYMYLWICMYTYIYSCHLSCHPISHLVFSEITICTTHICTTHITSRINSYHLSCLLKHTQIYICKYVYIYIYIYRRAYNPITFGITSNPDTYGVATVSRIDKIVGLFCRIWSF